MNYRERLAQSRMPIPGERSAEPEDFVSCPYFATDKSRNPACLDLRFRNGERKAFPYAYFTQINFDAESIEIRTARNKITITGRSLTRLYEYLVIYRVRYVQENIGIDTEEDGIFVKDILVEELDD